MDTIKISAKNLGYTALADFCPRCYWLRIKSNWKLPYQSFPGIFSSIDAYTKYCGHHIIDAHQQNPIKQLPAWMLEIGEIVIDTLCKHFPEIVNYDFTAKMEDDLDEIALGKYKWQEVLKKFYLRRLYL